MLAEMFLNPGGEAGSSLRCWLPRSSVTDFFPHREMQDSERNLILPFIPFRVKEVSQVSSYRSFLPYCIIYKSVDNIYKT